jgi:hypothetical protein
VTLQPAPETHTYFGTPFCVPDSHTFPRNRVFGQRKLAQRRGIRSGNPTFFGSRKWLASSGHGEVSVVAPIQPRVLLDFGACAPANCARRLLMNGERSRQQRAAAESDLSGRDGQSLIGLRGSSHNASQRCSAIGHAARPETNFGDIFDRPHVSRRGCGSPPIGAHELLNGGQPHFGPIAASIALRGTGLAL